ncbi:DUF1616 domain-containing protein [Methanotorris igneus]|uniref:DUF1616 domain-containing protein n=1 Tax=Methanotorris igneus (strain DSM 5666 / JCM 11834 / Kol 5) TaxID=880724 RepID=F6BAX4_METIK|nr:DUF1616 domain-containing protein [Methanotorris igneus]AEF97061.1 protein of unknown function DUF1616 [Methanotorris igneus Kol 5]
MDKRLLIQNIDIIFILLCLIIVSYYMVFEKYNILRVIFGSLMVLFFPGYLLINTLFFNNKIFNNLEKFGLSLGLSICITGLLGFVLSLIYIISEYTILLTISLWNIFFSMLLFIMRAYNYK